MGDLWGDERIILKSILKKYGIKIFTAFIWLRKGNNGEHF
jgi:hypothetical protein